MNEKEYLSFDIYDSVEVNATLRFAPYLHWRLFSIQDVFSRSDVFKPSILGTKKQTLASNTTNKSWNGNFAEAVNSSEDPNLSPTHETETHITSYTRLTLERDPSFLDRPRLAPIEKTWIRFSRLQRAIAKRAEACDSLYVSSAGNDGGNGGLITGLIIFGLSLPVLIFGLYLLGSMPPSVTVGSLYSFTNLFLYIGGGVAAFGLLLFIIGCIVSVRSRSSVRKSRKSILHCVKDYREVSANKRSFEMLVMEGKTPMVNQEWLYSLCLIYDVPCSDMAKKK